MDYSVSRRFTRFQNFLRDTLPKSLHGSGSPLGGSSESPSRKNSLTSLTHYLLFPKSRSLSTSSLPNLRTNAVLRPLRDTDLTKATFIGGIPVLTKRGKVVCYQDPGRDTRRRPQSNVYYPDPSSDRSQAEKSSKKSSKSKKPDVEPPVDSGETSGLLSSELETSENWQGSQDSSIWKRPMQVEPDIVIHVHNAEESTEHEPRGNRVSSESGFEEGEDGIFVTVAEVERRVSATTKADEYAPPAPSPAVKRNSAPLLEASPLPRRSSMEGSKCDMFVRPFSDPSGDRMELAVSPVSKSPSDSCIQHLSQPSMSKSSSDPNIKKGQHKSFRRHILKRLFSKTKHKGKGITVEDVPQERSRSSSVSPPHRGDSSRKQFEYLSPAGAGAGAGAAADFSAADRTTIFSKAASDTCLDRPDLSPKEDSSRTSFKVKQKVKKSKSERIKRKRQIHEPGARTLQKDILLAEDTSSGIRKTYSVKVRVRRLPSVERLDSAGDESLKAEGHQRKKHKKKGKHPTEEVVLEMEELPRCKTVDEFDFVESTIMPTSALTKAVAVTDDSGTRVGFYVPPEDLPLTPPALFRCASDPCLTFKRVEEKAIKRHETKKRKRQGRQGKSRKHHGVSICVFDEDQNDHMLRPTTARKHSSSCKSAKHVKKAVPDNSLLLAVHPPVFRAKSDPASKLLGAEEGRHEPQIAFPDASSGGQAENNDLGSCVDPFGSPSQCSSTYQPSARGQGVSCSPVDPTEMYVSISSKDPRAHVRRPVTFHPADRLLASAASYRTASNSASCSSGLPKTSSYNDLSLIEETRPSSGVVKRAYSETRLNVKLDSPHKTWTFIGMDTESARPDVETVL